MDYKQGLADWWDANIRRDHRPRKVTPGLKERIGASTGDGKLLQVSPYPENGGIEASEELWQSLHDFHKGFLGKNKSRADSFEIWFEGGTIQFYVYVPDERTEMKFRKQIDAEYPQAEISERAHRFPDIEVGEYIAGADLYLKHSKLYPVKSPNGVRDFINDPYRTITSEMISQNENRMLIQVILRPADPSWTQGGKWAWLKPGEHGVRAVADGLKQTRDEGTFSVKEVEPTKEDRQLADVVAQQEGLQAYDMNIRVMTISPKPNTASSNAWSIGKAFESTFQEAGDQTFVQRPLGGFDLIDMCESLSAREYIDTGMTLTIPEVAGVAHIPNESIETPSVNWNFTQGGGRLPANAERFEGGAEVPEFDEGEALNVVEEDLSEDGEGGLPPEFEEDSPEDPAAGAAPPDETAPAPAPDPEPVRGEESKSIFSGLFGIFGFGEPTGVQPAAEYREAGDQGSGYRPPEQRQPAGQRQQQPAGQRQQSKLEQEQRSAGGSQYPDATPETDAGGTEPTPGAEADTSEESDGIDGDPFSDLGEEDDMAPLGDPADENPNEEKEHNFDQWAEADNEEVNRDIPAPEGFDDPDTQEKIKEQQEKMKNESVAPPPPDESTSE